MADSNSISPVSYRDVHEPRAGLSSEDRWPGLVVNYDHFHPFQQNNFSPKEILIEINLGRKAAHLMYAADSRPFDGLVYPKHCLVVPAERLVRWELKSEATGLSLLLQPAFLHDLASREGMAPDRLELIAKIPTRDQDILDLGSLLLRELRREQQSLDCEEKVKVEGLAIALAGHLLKSYSTRPPKQSGRSDNLSQARLRKVLDHIAETLKDPAAWNGKKLAEIAGVSLRHFHHLFKKATGYPPHEYINQERDKWAKRLLREWRARYLHEIAAVMGFSEQAYFSRWFSKNNKGVTPSEFRKNYE